MKHNSDKESDTSDSSISESDIDDYEKKYYRRLQSKEVKVKSRDGSYRCPMCPGKKKQGYSIAGLIQHASDKGRHNKTAKGKAKHLALENFLGKKDIANAAGPSQRIASEPILVGKPPKNYQGDDLIVWPCMGVLANVRREDADGKYVGDSGTKTQEVLAKFNVAKVHPIWTQKRHTGYDIVEFNSEWNGFEDAMKFDKYFRSQCLGKKDWKLHNGCSSLYGWIAGEDDIKDTGPIGYRLRKHRDLKSVKNLSQLEHMRKDKLELFKKREMDTNEEQPEVSEHKYNRSSMPLDKKIQKRNRMEEVFKEELNKTGLKHHENTVKIFEAGQKEKLELENNLNDKQKMMASLELIKSSKKVLILMEKHKKDKKVFFERMLELGRQQNDKHRLELEIEQLRGQIQFMSHMEREDSEVKTKIKVLEEELDGKVKDLNFLQDNCKTLAEKESRSSDLVQDVREALIDLLKETQGACNNIELERIGELDDKPFLEIFKVRYPQEDVQLKAAELISMWQGELMKLDWNPYTMILVNGTHEVVIDEQDQKLKDLRNEYGDQVYTAVAKALQDLNRYSESSRHIAHETWHFTKNKKAAHGEVADYSSTLLQNRKRKRA